MVGEGARLQGAACPALHQDRMEGDAFFLPQILHSTTISPQRSNRSLVHSPFVPACWLFSAVCLHIRHLIAHLFAPARRMLNGCAACFIAVRLPKMLTAPLRTA